MEARAFLLNRLKHFTYFTWAMSLPRGFQAFLQS